MLDIALFGQNLERAAHLMQMLGHPIRLKILCILMDGEQSVQSLADQVNLSQPATSHHLKQLRQAELVQTRRDAQTINYALKGAEVTEIMAVLQRLYCAPETLIK